MANSAILIPLNHFLTVTTDQTMIAGVFYGANSGSQLNFALPASATNGDIFAVLSQDTGGFKVTQPANVTIIFGSLNTTVGTGGNIKCAQEGCVLIMECVVDTGPGYELQVIGSVSPLLVT